jgi:predicted ATPase
MSQERLGKLTKVVLRGFKSIKNCEIDLMNINVLIGANGAGKTNLLSALELLQSVLAGSLTYYANKKGIETLFYNGKESTDSIITEYHFGDDIYSFELEWTENNSLAFISESLILNGKEILGEGGHTESKVLNLLRNMSYNTEISKTVLNPSLVVYRFQDTTASSRKKSEQNVSNDVAFLSDGRNLAAFLYRLKRYFKKEYDDILYVVRLVAPFFEDFELEPRELNDELIDMLWQERGCDSVFNASQLSDGTLRFICLTTLLLQPNELQPDVVIIDEPELGLHPYAVTVFSELVKKVSIDKQIILSTQSVELLNNFEADDVIVVDKSANGSEFNRLHAESFTEWLEDDYTLGDLWNKNILGGRFAQ